MTAGSSSPATVECFLLFRDFPSTRCASLELYSSLYAKIKVFRCRGLDQRFGEFAFLRRDIALA